MTTISQIITDAYQSSNLVPLSAIPSSDEQAKALRYVNRIFKSLFGYELGDSLVDAILTDDGVYYSEYSDPVPFSQESVRPNTRLIYRATTPLTIILPSYPDAGARLSVIDMTGTISSHALTIDGAQRLIEGADTKTIDTDNENAQWFYREDLGSWQRVSTLTTSDEFPFPEEFEELFITLLSLRLNASEGISMDEQMGYVMRQIVKKFKSRYKQNTTVYPEQALVRLPSNITHFTKG